MSLARAVLIALVAITACSGKHGKSKVAAVDERGGDSYSGSPDGWWRDWHESLGSKPPYGPGTQFEVETLGAHGIRQTEVIEVVSINAQPSGGFALVLKSLRNGMQYRSSIPSDLLYSPGSQGSITTRNELLVPVTVPAGKFNAGRLWTSRMEGNTPYDRDEWVVPDIPVRVQTWSRPGSAKDLYNPPPDGDLPDGTVLTRLVRIDRK